LKLNVIAEGVESAKNTDLLKKSSCDEVQGFLYSKPLSAQEFESFVFSATKTAD
jgi:EAL domain-containing protein (putative c-di-GMP-specific phosphodiesterase class I)